MNIYNFNIVDKFQGKIIFSTFEVEKKKSFFKKFCIGKGKFIL